MDRKIQMNPIKLRWGRTNLKGHMNKHTKSLAPLYIHVQVHRNWVVLVNLAKEKPSFTHYMDFSLAEPCKLLFHYQEIGK